MVVLTVFSCKKETKSVTNTTTSAIAFSAFQNIPDTEKINLKAKETLNAWPEYQEMQNSFDVFYKATNNEDLILAIDDLLAKEKNLRGSKYPEIFDKLQVKSRQKVLRTFMLKVSASLAEQTNVNEPLKQMLTARNAFRNQFNLIVTNTFDPKLILEEN